MKKEDCFYLGVITRRHGLKGNLLVKLDTDQPSFFENMESVLVDFNGELIPLFLQGSKIYKDDILNILPEDTSESHIDHLKGREVYLPLERLPELTGTRFYYHEVIGFTVVDAEGQQVGTIEKINENVPQPYLICKMGETEINIPIIQDWILELDRENKIMKMNLPEGLIEVFLS